MEPKTKVQQRIWGMSANLPPISKVQKEFAFSKVLRHVGHRSKKGITCMDCGEFYEDSTTHKRSTCPQCNTRLEVVVTRKKKFSQCDLMAILTVVNGIQISRTVEVYGHHQAGRPVRYFIDEIYQHFFDVNGKNHIVAKQRNCFNDSFNGSLEIRRNSEAYCYRHSVAKVCRGYKVLPIFKKLGFKGDLHRVSPFAFFSEINRHNRAETLLKAGQGALFQLEILGRGRAYEYWNSIKICIRNNYCVKDGSMYYDYLQLLRRMGKDLCSPKYVCPKNLKKEHDRYVKKVREMDKKRDQAARIARIRENEQLYREMKQAFFGICFVQGDITVKVLESVQEFMEQGDIHKHCVFTNEYFRKKDSLVMAAVVKGVPVETVEISLSSMEILQSRGASNNPSPYNEDIRNVVIKNLGQIRSIYESLQEAN